MSANVSAVSAVAPAHDGSFEAVASKERELSAITEYRARALEAALLERDREVASLAGRLASLREDFAANLGLFEARDAELAAQDEEIAALRSAVGAREAEVAALTRAAMTPERVSEPLLSSCRL